MGCCESCLKPRRYEPVPDKRESGEAAAFARSSDGDETDPDVDLSSPVYAGSDILQKFTNKSSYDRRFVWLNLKSRTIHMSQHMTKERRHKEASLDDVTSVIYGPPLKSKVPVSDRQCVTVHFKRGGGIDLLFATEAESVLWFAALNRICQASKVYGQTPDAQ